MKKLSMILLAAWVLGTTGCEEMNERHQKYLDEGEQVYIGRVDSLKTFSGFERAKITWEYNHDPKLEKLHIYWNLRERDTVIDVDRSNGLAGNIIIPLPEGKYTFELETTGANNTEKSITAVASVTVYGIDYQAALNSRQILSQVIDNGKINIGWGSVQNSVGVKMEYVNNVGARINRFISDEESKTVIADFKPGGEFFYETLYVPEEGAIDTIPTLTKQRKVFPLPINVSGWTKLYASSEQTLWDDGTPRPLDHIYYKGAEMMLGDPSGQSRPWEANYPKWGNDEEPIVIVFKMDQEQEFNSFWVKKEKQIHKVKIFYSMDDTGEWNTFNWSPFGVIEFEFKADGGDIRNVVKEIGGELVKARSIKLEITNKGEPEASISLIGMSKFED